MFSEVFVCPQGSAFHRGCRERECCEGGGYHEGDAVRGEGAVKGMCREGGSHERVCHEGGGSMKAGAMEEPPS